MSAKEATAFQKSIRAGLEEAARKEHKKRLDDIDVLIRTQHAECAQETEQTAASLAAAEHKEREAIAAAKADKRKAQEALTAARHRARIAKNHKRAQTAQKKRACKVEAEGFKAKREAEREHQRELRRIEGMLRKRKKPLMTSREKLEEQRDEVDAGIAPELRPLWRKVRRSFRVNPDRRWSMQEAFEHYAMENPDAVLAAQEAEAEVDLRRMQAEYEKGKRKHVPQPRKPKAGQPPFDPDLRDYMPQEGLEEAPF